MSSLASAEQRSHDLAGLEAGLGHRFGDPGLLRDATTHRSWCAENGGTSNERLEFLGDAVLGMVIADQLFRDHQHAIWQTFSFGAGVYAFQLQGPHQQVGAG